MRFLLLVLLLFSIDSIALAQSKTSTSTKPFVLGVIDELQSA
ncbi:MAG: hypothetical protein JWP88_2233 [Flaviaesturariibacter sp.]|nr:hypothetical protein [Flaviaesturariibacter sp.]